MPRQTNINMVLVDPDDNGIAEAQTTGGSGNLALDGVEVVDSVWKSLDDLPRLIALTSAGVLNGINFTIEGFADKYNFVPLSEVIAGPNANTVFTQNYFHTITNISVDAAVGTDVIIGTTNQLISPIIPLNHRGGAVGLNYIVGGTLDYTVEQTLDDITNVDNYPFNWLPQDDPLLVNATASQNGNYFIAPIATRVKINSYSSGSSLNINIAASDV